MALNPTNSAENLESLLVWLDPDDKERASSRYLSIRGALVKVFESRGCDDADHLADITIDRVMRKVDLVATTFEGAPSLYFYGVARNVLHEHRRQRPKSYEILESITTAITHDDNSILEMRSVCLEDCLAELDTDDARLITEYYSYERGEKAETRQGLANENGLTLTNLRIRAFRIRKKLRECLETCFEGQLIN